MTKKAQGMPFNAIVIAALVLIVLFVLILIFTGRIGTFGKGAEQATEQSCLAMNNKDEGNTYKCVDSCDESDSIEGTKDCQIIGKTCCKTAKTTE